MPITLYADDVSHVVQSQVLSLAAVKSAWNDSWIFVPDLEPLSMSDGAHPHIPRAQLQMRYGMQRNPWESSQYAHPYQSYLGGYVMIQCDDGFTSIPMWCGIIDNEDVAPHGTTGYPQGITRLSAVGLQALLARQTIRGSWANCGGTEYYIDRPLRFNEVGLRGTVIQGNRSETVGVNGSYYFDRNVFTSGVVTSYQWRRRDIVEYLLSHYANPDLTSTTGYQGPYWYLTGAVDALNYVDDCFDLTGASVLDALGLLIDRRRGLGFRVGYSAAASGPVIEIFTIFQAPVELETGVMPANQNQCNVSLIGGHIIEPEINISAVSQYSAVRIEGGPVRVCGTFHVSQSAISWLPFSAFTPTLVPMWTETQEAYYKMPDTGVVSPKAGDYDLVRQAQNLMQVYQKFGVPSNWDWTLYGINCIPAITDEGVPDFNLTAAQSNLECTFCREIPVYEYDVDGAFPTLRRPFVLAYKPTEYATSADKKITYVHKEAGFGDAASVHIGDNDLTILVQPSINHVAGLNHIVPGEVGTPGVGDSNTQPKYDYATYLATLMLATDSCLHVQRLIPGSVNSDLCSIKVLHDPTAELWLMIPGTVTDLDSTETDGLLRYAGDVIWRDDSPRLRSIVEMAIQWFQQRATMRLAFNRIELGFWPGVLIAGSESAEGYTCLGTVVTDIQWDLVNGKTLLNTGYEEFDYVR